MRAGVDAFGHPALDVTQLLVLRPFPGRGLTTPLAVLSIQLHRDVLTERVRLLRSFGSQDGLTVVGQLYHFLLDRPDLVQQHFPVIILLRVLHASHGIVVLAFATRPRSRLGQVGVFKLGTKALFLILIYTTLSNHRSGNNRN